MTTPRTQTEDARRIEQRREIAHRIAEQVGARAPAELPDAVEALLARADSPSRELIQGFVLDGRFSVPIRRHDLLSGGKCYHVYRASIFGHRPALRRRLAALGPRPTWEEAEVIVRAGEMTIRFDEGEERVLRFDEPGVPFSTRIAASALRRAHLAAIQWTTKWGALVAGGIRHNLGMAHANEAVIVTYLRGWLGLRCFSLTGEEIPPTPPREAHAQVRVERRRERATSQAKCFDEDACARQALKALIRRWKADRSGQFRADGRSVIIAGHVAGRRVDEHNHLSFHRIDGEGTPRLGYWIPQPGEEVTVEFRGRAVLFHDAQCRRLFEARTIEDHPLGHELERIRPWPGDTLRLVGVKERDLLASRESTVTWGTHTYVISRQAVREQLQASGMASDRMRRAAVLFDADLRRQHVVLWILALDARGRIVQCPISARRADSRTAVRHRTEAPPAGRTFLPSHLADQLLSQCSMDAHRETCEHLARIEHCCNGREHPPLLSPVVGVVADALRAAAVSIVSARLDEAREGATTPLLRMRQDLEHVADLGRWVSALAAEAGTEGCARVEAAARPGEYALLDAQASFPLQVGVVTIRQNHGDGPAAGMHLALHDFRAALASEERISVELDACAVDAWPAERVMEFLRSRPECFRRAARRLGLIYGGSDRPRGARRELSRGLRLRLSGDGAYAGLDLDPSVAQAGAQALAETPGGARAARAEGSAIILDVCPAESSRLREALCAWSVHLSTLAGVRPRSEQ